MKSNIINHILSFSNIARPNSVIRYPTAQHLNGVIIVHAYWLSKIIHTGKSSKIIHTGKSPSE